MHLEGCGEQLRNAMQHRMNIQRERLLNNREHLQRQHPAVELATWRGRLASATSALRHRHLSRAIEDATQRLNAAEGHLRKNIKSSSCHQEMQLQKLAARLEDLSPVSTLARGFSVIRDNDGKVIRHPDQAPVGSTITATVAGGSLTRL